MELGEVAEGLTRTTAPVRRHLRTCERCATFRKQLRQTNKALAALFPVGPLFLLKKTLLAHLGTSAAAGGGTAAASGSAAAAGAAAGGAMQAGLSTLATKTVAGLAAAAIVTAGAVEVKQVARKPRDKTATVMAAAAPVAPAAAPAVAAPAPEPKTHPRSTGDRYKPDAKKAKAADAKAPEKAATAPAAETGTGVEQHDSATSELPTETTGSTEDSGGVIVPPPATRHDTAVRDAAAGPDADAHRADADADADADPDADAGAHSDARADADAGTRLRRRRPCRSRRNARAAVRLRAPMIDFDDFLKVDMRVGRVVAVEDFPEARKPAYKLTIDFGPEIGTKRSSAQITNYAKDELEGRLVVAVVNFPPRQIGPFMSEVLTLGAADEEGRVILLAPDTAVPLGARIH